MPADTSYYRSLRQVLPWQVLCGVYLAAVLGPWGPSQWHATPSLRWLHMLLPWTVVAVAFAVYAVLLALRRPWGVVIAQSIGTVMFALEGLALLATSNFHRPNNPFLHVCIVLTIVMHLRMLWLAVQQLERR